MHETRGINDTRKETPLVSAVHTYTYVTTEAAAESLRFLGKIFSAALIFFCFSPVFTGFRRDAAVLFKAAVQREAGIVPMSSFCIFFCANEQLSIIDKNVTLSKIE